MRKKKDRTLRSDPRSRLERRAVAIRRRSPRNSTSKWFNGEWFYLHLFILPKGSLFGALSATAIRPHRVVSRTWMALTYRELQILSLSPSLCRFPFSRSAVSAPPNKVERPVGSEQPSRIEPNRATSVPREGGDATTTLGKTVDTAASIASTDLLVRPDGSNESRAYAWKRIEKYSPSSAGNSTRSENAALWLTPWWCGTVVVSSRYHDATQRSLNTVLTCTRTITPSRARKSCHFSRTFDGITLAAAMFDTVAGYIAHARPVGSSFPFPL